MRLSVFLHHHGGGSAAADVGVVVVMVVLVVLVIYVLCKNVRQDLDVKVQSTELYQVHDEDNMVEIIFKL